MKIAVIGSGKQGQRHLASLHRIGDAVAVDIDPERARAAASQAGVAWHDSVDAALADATIAAVIIAAPTRFHAELARRAAGAGKHVLCEKPFGAHEWEARDLAHRVASRGLVGRVAYLYRFAPAIRAARDAIGRLGAIESAHFAIAGPGDHAVWKHRQESGGGVANELLSHMIDLALWFFGPVRDCTIVERQRVKAARQIGGVAADADADDRMVVRMKAGNDVAITLDGDFTAPRFRQWLEIRGTRGSVRASIDPGFAHVLRLDGIERPLNSYIDETPYQLQMRAFVTAIRGRPTPMAPCSFAEAADVCAILEQLNRAS